MCIRDRSYTVHCWSRLPRYPAACRLSQIKLPCTVSFIFVSSCNLSKGIIAKLWELVKVCVFLCDCVPVKSHPDICCVFYSSLPLIRPLFLQLVLRTQTGRKERTAKKLVMTKASQNVRVGSDRSGMSSYKSGIIVKFLTMFRRLSILMTFSDIYFLLIPQRSHPLQHGGWVPGTEHCVKD